MFVKPAPGRTVPDPERGGVLPVEGRDVPVTTYWERRKADNDVVVEDEPATNVQPTEDKA